VARPSRGAGFQSGGGILKPETAKDAEAAAISGEIEHMLRWWPVQPGDTVFVPAGTVHAIGSGITICEIQQNSDVTYRLFDYGRPRELHLEQGIKISKLEPHEGIIRPPAGAPRRLRVFFRRQGLGGRFSQRAGLHGDCPRGRRSGGRPTMPCRYGVLHRRGDGD
jgi:hypothetical protein